MMPFFCGGRHIICKTSNQHNGYFESAGRHIHFEGEVTRVPVAFLEFFSEPIPTPYPDSLHIAPGVVIYKAISMLREAFHRKDVGFCGARMGFQGSNNCFKW